MSMSRICSMSLRPVLNRLNLKLNPVMLTQSNTFKSLSSCIYLKREENVNYLSKWTSAQKAQFSTSKILCQDEPSPAEAGLIKALAESFPKATDIAVVDISGGCGSMYEVYVEAPDFKGMRMVKQHKLVTAALKKEIGDMHGIRISTNASPCQPSQ